MADREERIRVFEETVRMCSEHTRLADSVRQTRENQLYFCGETAPADCGAPRFDTPAKRILSRDRSFAAAARYADTGKRICVHNFASAMNPGGGVSHGATAQEESLCRISTLYPALTAEKARAVFYDAHRADVSKGEMNRRNNDDIIYSPGITVFRADTLACELLPESQWFAADVLTCAAPDLRRAFDGSQYRPAADELRAVFETRIEKILRCAAAQKADILILGAFGCGAFRNSPELVARAFDTVLSKYAQYFDTVEFAVYCGHDTENYDEFAAISDIQPRG